MPYRTALLRDHWPPMIRITVAALSALAVPLTLSAALLAVRSLTLSPSTVAAGEQSTGTVTLDLVPIGSVSVTLSNSNPSVAQVPASVSVGRTSSVPFLVRTSAPGCASIAARVGATAPQTATLFVNPPPPPTITLSPLQLTLANSRIIGGQATSGSVTVLTGGATIQLSSSNPEVKVPASVVVSSAATPMAFPIQTNTVRAATCSLITASFGGSRSSALLQVLPAGG